MVTIGQVKSVLDEALHLDGRVKDFTVSTRLFGSLPELDSMAVLQVITALEQRFGIVIDDDDISAETFETLGSLAAFIDRKLGLG